MILTKIVIGASGAIGAAIADRLEEQGDTVLRVARTISNLAGSEQIDRPHLAEALAYRAMPLLA